MNLNHQQLETLVNFSEVLTFLSNPDKLTKTLSEAKSTLAEIKSYMGAKTTLEKVEAYRKEQEAYFAEQLRQLGIERANDVNTLTKEKANLIKLQESTLSIKNTLSAKLESLTTVENSINEKQQRIEALKVSLDKRQADLSLKEAELSVRKAELDKKAEQLKNILG